VAIRPRFAAFITLAATALAGAGMVGVSVGAPSAAARGEGAKISLARTSHGKALVGANGHSLYMFTRDSKNHSHCNAACRRVWVPVTSTSKPHAGAGVSASHLKLIKGHQVTYFGKPLYTYVPDKKAHQTKGEDAFAFGGYWWLLKGSGSDLT
jgi:predicted lipoprotein with Yx(FWY)xxD motif